MFDAAHTSLVPAREVARSTPLTVAANGLRWASYGYTEVPLDTLQHLVEAIPPGVARLLASRAYYFVPLALGETEETEIASGFTADLSERATCHRSVATDGVESTFISARLMQDRFALAFELFINIGHQLVDCSPVPQRFQELAWAQARAEVRGETSQDAWEARKRALEAAATLPPNVTPFLAALHAAPDELPAPEPWESGSLAPSVAGGAPVEASPGTVLDQLRGAAQQGLGSALRNVPPRSAPGGAGPAAMPGAAVAPGAANGSFARMLEGSAVAGARATDERAAAPYFEAAFADTLAIYMLSLAMDLDYADLREREYPLLAAPALADRLRLTAELFPPAPNYEFAIKYRRRH